MPTIDPETLKTATPEQQAVLAESVQKPGELIKSAPTGTIQTGTEQKPVTFQAITRPGATGFTDNVPTESTVKAVSSSEGAREQRSQILSDLDQQKAAL